MFVRRSWTSTWDRRPSIRMPIPGGDAFWLLPMQSAKTDRNETTFRPSPRLVPSAVMRTSSSASSGLRAPSSIEGMK